MTTFEQKMAALRKTVVRNYKPGEDLLDIFRKALDRNNLDIRVGQAVTDGVEQTFITMVDVENALRETTYLNHTPFNTRTIEKWIRVNFMLPMTFSPASEEQVEFILKNSTAEQLQVIVEKYQIHDLKELTHEVADALIRRIKTINKAEGRQKR